LVFNSLVFIEFALVFFGLWWFVRDHKHFRYVFLIVASCLFYGYGGWWFVPLLLATATIDFYMARMIYDRPHEKRLWLTISVVSNLSVLATFKYLGFFAQSVNSLLGLAGAPAALPVMHLILPIGISFYTFQSLSYIFDVYRGAVTPTPHLLHFLSIVTLFPHLVAGPIVRVRHMLPQIEEMRKPSSIMVWDGLQLIAFGLFKKMVLADNLAPTVDKIYGSPSSTSTAYLLATIAFSLQIYYDFSGYTDVARGLAKWLGIEFTLNFNHPYTAIGIRDFWSRWHMSLSYWIRDYVYIPLGGSRDGEWRAHRNSWIAMLASGLWHGANWTFIIWGGLHALFQSIERITDWPKKVSKTTFGKLAGCVATFAIVTLAWVFFRADTTLDAFRILGAIFSPSGYQGLQLDLQYTFWTAFVLSVCIETYHVLRRHLEWTFQTNELAYAVGTAILLFACIYLRGPGKAFIYFQF
jgi:D-alanyl-lipoteichoic acid acyltransferase DltB (MBOAT superfamily)